MKLGAYSIYDRKALQYHPPYYAVTDGAAVRSFADLANDRTTTIGRHPVDYVLFYVGSYDDALGLLIAETPLRHIADGSAQVTANLDLFGVDTPDPHFADRTARNGAQ